MLSVKKAQQYFVSSIYMFFQFLGKKTLRKIWLNPWLNLTILQGTKLLQSTLVAGYKLIELGLVCYSRW